MALDRESFLKVLEDAYSAYYNIVPDVDAGGLPLIFRADYFSRNERYFILKENTIWGNETNEYCYLFSAPSFDVQTVNKCIDYAIADMLPRVKPHKEHQYTNVKTVFVADGFDDETIKLIKKRKFSKNYRFSLYGYTALLTAAVDLSREQAFTNPTGQAQQDFFKKLFSLRKDSPD